MRGGLHPLCRYSSPADDGNNIYSRSHLRTIETENGLHIYWGAYLVQIQVQFGVSLSRLSSSCCDLFLHVVFQHNEFYGPTAQINYHMEE